MPGTTTGARRHFEGWEVGALAVFMALVPAILVIPRAVQPSEVPVPVIDARELARSARQDEADAIAAQRVPLDVDVRAIGSAYRAFGHADAADDELAMSAARQQLMTVGEPARRIGGDALRKLRAYQLWSFQREVRRWEATGEESAELRELGGGFVRMLTRNGWSESDGARRRVLLDPAALRASFKLRWNEVVGLSAPELVVPLEERRALLGFAIAHPLTPPGGAVGAGQPGRPDVRTAYEGQFMLRKIDELAAIDESYPAHLARGVVLYKLQRYPSAMDAFQKHLDARPDGAHTLRARNYLKEAMLRAREP